MQNKHKTPKVQSLPCDGQAQGAIEYLLILGAAILLVAVVVAILPGMLGTGTETADTSTKSYLDTLKDTKYENIGFKFIVLPGQHDSFTVFVVPADNTIGSIFAQAPVGTLVKINTNGPFKKTESGWNDGASQTVNQGDELYIEVPESATAPLELEMKGDYTEIPPRKINFTCDGTENWISAQIPFEPKEKDPKIIFKDLFDFPQTNTQLSLYSPTNYTEYQGVVSCGGEMCQSLDETQCNSYPSYDYCEWNTETTACQKRYSYYLCEWFWGDPTYCSSIGCTPGETELELINSGSEEITSIGIGTDISLYCAPGQILNAEIEEDQSAEIERIESLTFSDSQNYSFLLKNYSCYSFQDLKDKIYSEFYVLNTQQWGYINLYCTRGNEWASYYYYNYGQWGSGEYNDDPYSMTIQKDTICSTYVAYTEGKTVNFTC